MRNAARDDVRVGAAVVVAVEGPVVHHHAVLDAGHDVGAGGVGEQQSQAARIPTQVVRRELIGAGSLREYARSACLRHAVTAELVARDLSVSSPAIDPRSYAIHIEPCELIPLDL